MLRVPYSFLPPALMEKLSHYFYGFSHRLKPLFPFLEIKLKQAEAGIGSEEYLSRCFLATSFFFLFILIFFFLILNKLGVENAFFASFTIALITALFVFFQQLAYPQLIAKRRVREIEINLLPALQSFIIQLNSGVPLFNILVNISLSDYGALSSEFKKAVKKIKAGHPQTEVIEEMAANNPSLLFRRALWQITNGMKAGSDMSSVIEEVTRTLSEEQLIFIQRYGSQLNPLAMFYMLGAIIVPSLSITFIIVLASLISFPEASLKLAFWAFYGFTVFVQLMFLGVIKAKRPSLLPS